MKTLVALCALVACCTANPGFAYNTAYAHGLGLGLVSPSLYGAPGLLASSRLLAAPHAIAAPAYAHAIAAPAIAAPALAAPVIAARTIAAPAPVVAAPALPAPVIAAPAPVVAAPVIPAAPAVTKSQWHAQTELGQASYGHAEPLQTHAAHQDAHGNKVGSFSYLNPHDGQIHRTDYVADALGYRVAANDLPVDTPEVALAKSAHLAAHLRARRGLGYSIAAPYGLAAAPLALGAAPLGIAAAPAHYSAIQTTIVNNPGHAVSYRID